MELPPNAAPGFSFQTTWLLSHHLPTSPQTWGMYRCLLLLCQTAMKLMTLKNTQHDCPTNIKVRSWKRKGKSKPCSFPEDLGENPRFGDYPNSRGYLEFLACGSFQPSKPAAANQITSCWSLPIITFQWSPFLPWLWLTQFKNPIILIYPGSFKITFSSSAFWSAARFPLCY